MYDHFYLCILYKYVFLQYVFQGCDRDYILVFTFLMNIYIEDSFFFTLNEKKKNKNKRKHPTNPGHTAFACIMHILLEDQ